MTSLSRRDWLRLTLGGTAGLAGMVGWSRSGWLQALAADAASNPQRQRSCILLWMSGGPSQLDTFDLKPGHANGGPFKSIATTAPGVQISEHFPQLAKFGAKLAIVRSMNSKEGDHGRATYLLRTGNVPQGPIQYPTLGSLISKEIGDDRSELPNFVSVAPFRVFNQGAYGAGFLGPRYAPLIVGERRGVVVQQAPNATDRALRVEDLATPPEVGKGRIDSRIDLLCDVQRDFLADHPDLPAVSHQNAYDRAVRLMRTSAAKAFNLEEEKAAIRDGYGRNLFGQGCLLARRLVERRVPFVEVTLDGWDTHGGNAAAVKNLSQTVDAGLGVAAARFEGARPAGNDADCVDGRIWPDAEVPAARWPGPLAELVQRGAVGRRHQGRPGDRRHRPGRRLDQGSPCVGAGVPGDHLRCAGHRPPEAEHVQRGPAHPHCGPGHEGGAGSAGISITRQRRAGALMRLRRVKAR